ncbi:MAG: peptidoglycan editing factor PgeF [Gammaproteobacteria bacterium]
MSGASALNNTGLDWIEPTWPAPHRVRACTTTRQGGVSVPPYDSLNLAQHVGDDAQAVRENRRRLTQILRLPAEPIWLDQVHGACAVDAASVPPASSGLIKADAIYAKGPDQVCAVLTADCLPLLLCNHAGTQVAAVHAGWRGLAAGVIEAAVAAFEIAPGHLMAWLGPAIGPHSYAVGAEVRAAFVDKDSAAAQAFTPVPARSPLAVKTRAENTAFPEPEISARRWYADMYALARLRLAAIGVRQVYGGNDCTLSDPRFYSYRRNGITGRMATLIWIETVTSNK